MEKIALLPGGFKPPHAGHYNMAKWLANNTDADTVVIKVGAKERDGITREISLKLWNLYRLSDPDSPRIAILPSNSNSPVTDVYDFIEKEAPEGSIVYLGMGEKDATSKRFANIGKFAEPKDIKFKITLVPPQDGGISGSDMRDFIKNGDKESFQKYIPKHLTQEQKDQAWEMVSSLEEMMYGTMTKQEKAKHAKNLKRLKKDMSKQGDQYEKVPDYLKGTLTRKYYNEDLYSPEDKVLDYMRSSEYKAGLPDGSKEDIPHSYKYKRGGVYGRMYEEKFAHHSTSAAKIDDIIIPLEIADTPEKQIRGMMGRDEMDGGMIFPYDQISQKDFHMEGCKIPLDIIFIKGEKINKIHHNCPPCKQTPCPKYSGIADNVLELPGGYCKKHNIKTGDEINLNLAPVDDKPIYSLKERDLSAEEERIAQSLPDKEFKKRYGKDWKAVKIATATKMAKKNENFPPYKANQVQQVRYKASDVFTRDIKKAEKMGYLEGDTYEKMAAKGKKKGNLKQGTVRKRLKIKAGDKIPLSKINKAISRIKKMKNPSKKNKKFLKALNLAKTLKTTTNLSSKKENIDPKSQAKHKGKSAPYGSAYKPINERDPKKGTGKKPKGSGRRLYTDENPKDTVKVKFSTRQDIVDTLSKKSFKAKSHARKSQIINLIHQRVRAALGRTKDPQKKKRLKSAFEYIKKRKEASKRKTKRMRKEATFTKNWWAEIITEMLLTEGGAAGHMAHPFNLPDVNNGKSLLDIFKKAADSLDEKPGAIKIDGVNSSIRLVDLNGKKQFVMDRGSKMALDVKGITKADLEDRFKTKDGSLHGMVKVGGEVLDIFNEALPSLETDLKKLGAFDNPNILFNMEYVDGKTNVQDYSAKFIAIHGLNKIEGERKEPGQRESKEIPYDKTAFQSLLDNLKPAAEKRGYEVYGSVPTTMTKKPNFNAALSKKYTINAGEASETKSLGQLLDELDNIPKEDFIGINVGYKADSSTRNIVDKKAVSKIVYQSILNGENIDGLFEDAEDRKKAVQGFTTYLATEKLGDEVLKVLDSPMGSADKHEGVVIRDESIADVPFKITGRFILGGMASDF